MTSLKSLVSSRRSRFAFAVPLLSGTLLACSDSTGPERPVVASIAVFGLPDSVGVGDELHLVAEPRDAAGDRLATVPLTWRSLAPDIADIDSTGLLRGLSTGDAHVIVGARGRTLREDTLLVRVRRLPRRFAFSDVPDSVLVGSNDTITVEVQDGVGRPLGPVVTWSSSDTSVLRVDSMGVVRAMDQGSAWIRASAGDRADSVRVRGEYRQVMLGRPYTDVGSGSTGRLCALTASGEVWCAPTTTSATAFRTLGSASMRTIESGQSQSCGLAADSTLYCRGTNSNRVFGTVVRTDPVSVDTLYPGGLHMRWRAFTLGDHQQACGIAAADSVVYCWGHNDTQQVGRAPASATDSLVAPFATPLRAKQVDLSGFHGCAVTFDDAVWCWGASHAFGGTGPDAVPTQVQPAGSFVQVTTGDGFTCALTAAGEARCWGDLGATSVPRTSPAAVGGNVRFARLFTGFNPWRACGITAAGALYCWNPGDDVMTPRAVMSGRTFTTMSIGLSTCALATDGKLYCW